MSPLRLLLRAIGVAVAGVLLIGGPARAHDSLEGAVPAPDSTVRTPPTDLELRFSADPRAITVTAVDASGAPLGLGPTTRSGDTAQVDWPTTAAGRYLVSWRIISSDGHPVGGSYTFTVDPEATPSSPASAGSTSRTATIVAVPLAVVAGALGVGIVGRRRRQRARAAHAEDLGP